MQSAESTDPKEPSATKQLSTLSQLKENLPSFETPPEE